MRLLDTGLIEDNLFAVKTLSVNFYLHATPAGYVCFDAGFSKPMIRKELRKLNVDPKDVKHVFLTHSDFDHTGGLSLFTNAQVYLLKDEQPLVSGLIWRAPGLSNRLPANVIPIWLNDGQVVRINDTTVEVVHAPGHTPGSAAYRLNNSMLITGDCFKIRNGIALPVPAVLNMDHEQHRQSILKLAALKDISLACTAHSGLTRRIMTA